MDVYIVDDSEEGAVSWQTIFTNAVITYSVDEIIQMIANGKPGLVILASTFTALDKSCIDRILSYCIDVINKKGYDGFYIDDYFNPYPLTTEISEVSVRQVLQTSVSLKGEIVNVPIERRSYYLTVDGANKWLSLGVTPLPAQLYPAIVSYTPQFPTSRTIEPLIFLIIFVLLFLALFYWLAMVIS